MRRSRQRKLHCYRVSATASFNLVTGACTASSLRTRGLGPCDTSRGADSEPVSTHTRTHTRRPESPWSAGLAWTAHAWVFHGHRSLHDIESDRSPVQVSQVICVSHTMHISILVGQKLTGPTSDVSTRAPSPGCHGSALAHAAKVSLSATRSLFVKGLVSVDDNGAARSIFAWL